MTPAGDGLEAIDWSRPWLAPWRTIGVPLAEAARQVGLVRALNDALAERPVRLSAGVLRFVPQEALPPREPYEAFIARHAAVPTRANLHDFFNGLMWLAQPRLKRRLNELQAAQIAAQPAGGVRGRVRDALTLFDENAAWLQGPPALLEALRARDWQALFVSRREAWHDARLTLFGHALLEKLVRPRKAITAHVWIVPPAAGDARQAGERIAEALAPALLAHRPFAPLPVLGVPDWWAPNEAPSFYADAAVFRPPKERRRPEGPPS